ncbi:expressed unknown protein [Seminavis robusta]|uniref:Uncharacterized protein n=1 Tax=Seminavis robusta TaxID=568900 RepID=A0A9N8HC86_9STRA|nr:expressed unknown protein [Seminavis robusta]|eukprot:Sro291_g109500.1 n/a (86) ;mRNA; r:53815-54293
MSMMENSGWELEPRNLLGTMKHYRQQQDQRMKSSRLDDKGVEEHPKTLLYAAEDVASANPVGEEDTPQNKIRSRPAPKKIPSHGI